MALGFVGPPAAAGGPLLTNYRRIYSLRPETATIAASPGRASDAKQRHSNASRHGEETLPHRRSQPPGGPQTFRSALLGNRIPHAGARQELQRPSAVPTGRRG